MRPKGLGFGGTVATFVFRRRLSLGEGNRLAPSNHASSPRRHRHRGTANPNSHSKKVVPKTSGAVLKYKAKDTLFVCPFVGLLVCWSVPVFVCSCVRMPPCVRLFVCGGKQMVPENMKKPYEFELFHASTREPLDLYAWGNDFFRPLVELENSR